MFREGDRVYHRNLGLVGIFIEYDWIDSGEAYVDFGQDGYEDCRRVTVDWLEPADEYWG